MDLRKKKQNDDFDDEVIQYLQIKDSTGILGVSIAVIFVYFLFVVMSYEDISKSDGGIPFVFLQLLSVIVMPLLVLRLRSIWDGVVIDMDEGIISFPGGGLEANDLFDYLKPKFLLQIFQRITIDISSLQQISKNIDYKLTLSKFFSSSNKKDNKTLVHVLHLTGDFGAASIPFINKQKRNQAYASLAYYLEMGDPVVVR